MNKADKAIEYFRNDFNCSQSVLTVFGPDFDLPENTCLKLGCAFGGGMGRQQLTCGAVSGAMMVLGLKYGKAAGDPEEMKKETYGKTCELFTEFKKMNGSVNCRDLLDGLDMNDPDDLQIIKAKDLFVTKCEKYVRDAVSITEDMVRKTKSNA